MIKTILTLALSFGVIFSKKDNKAAFEEEEDLERGHGRTKDDRIPTLEEAGVTVIPPGILDINGNPNFSFLYEIALTCKNPTTSTCQDAVSDLFNKEDLNSKWADLLYLCTDSQSIFGEYEPSASDCREAKEAIVGTTLYGTASPYSITLDAPKLESMVKFLGRV